MFFAISPPEIAVFVGSHRDADLIAETPESTGYKPSHVGLLIGIMTRT
jgi:hypothetical protein